MTTPQNIYDDPAFFAGYETLRKSGTGLNDALEQPALLSLLPERFDGLRVLDLGCGCGGVSRPGGRGGAGGGGGPPIQGQCPPGRDAQDRIAGYLRALREAVSRQGR